MKISMIGLGKLGLPVATVMSKHCSVVGYDVGPIHADFPLKATISGCIEDSNFIFVAVPTPHDKDYSGDKPTSQLPPKDFDYSIVKDVLTKIARYKTPDQQVVLISTVMPGTVRREFSPIIPDIIYNPSLIALGSVAKDFTDPEMVIIGSDNNPKVSQLVEFYKTICGENVHKMVGSWQDAEITKIFYNTYLVTKITLANTIHDVAQRVGDTNVDNITNGLMYCNRKVNGPLYFTAGLGLGGPCFPRDVIAMNWLAQDINMDYDFFGNIMGIRESQAQGLAKKLCSYGLPVVILGQSYKPNVAFNEGSYTRLVGHYVSELGSELYYHDPLINIEHTGNEPSVYLISYHHDWLNDYNYIPNSIIVDPWRKNLSIPNCTVINL